MRVAGRVKQGWNRLDVSWRIAITVFLFARLFYAAWSWIILTVQPVAVHYVGEGGQKAVIFLSLRTLGTDTYLRRVDGQELSFRPGSSNTVLDLQTGSTWDIQSGSAVAGRYEGTVLTRTTTPSDMFPYLDAKPYPLAWLGMWQRFDANWYISIADDGYGQFQGDHAFPPLYPLLIHLLTPVFGDAFLAGLFISHVATLYALNLLYSTFAQWGNQHTTQQALIFFMLFPTSFFLFSVYTEPLFLALVLLAMQCMKNRSWHWAGFWTFFATLTRVQGAALIFPMLYLIWNDRPFLRKSQHWIGLFSAGLGLLLYLYLRSIYSPGSISTTSSLWEPVWHWHFVTPWEGYLYALQVLFSGHANYIDFLNWAAISLFLLLLFVGWKMIPIEHSLYVAFSLLIMLTRVIETKPLNSVLRYLITLYPIFFILALMGNGSWKRRLVAYTFLALNLYLSAQFFTWGWVA